MKKILITDPSLRDGNHAVNHQISKDVIAKYCRLISKTNIKVVEVGHGNGLGASSLSIGRAKVNLKDTIKIAKKNLSKVKLSIHSIPGFSTLNQLKSAIDFGVDIFRINLSQWWISL